MFNLLLQFTVKKENLKTEKRILNLSMAGSIVFLLAEIFFAIYTGSKAVLMDCVYDVANLIMVGPFLFLVPLLYKPVNEKRPFGFAQVESLFVLIKYCVLLTVDVILAVNCFKTLISGGNEVDASVLAIFEIGVSAGCIVMYFVLSAMQKKYSSPSTKAELFIWRLDAMSTMGVGLAFLVNLGIMRTPLAFISPYVDPGIAVILAIMLMKEPIEMIIDSVRNLVLFAPDASIKENIERIGKPLMEREGSEITNIDVIKTGRKLWVEIYFLPKGNSVDLIKLKDIRKIIIDELTPEYDSIDIEMLVDMDQYHVHKKDKNTILDAETA